MTVRWSTEWVCKKQHHRIIYGSILAHFELKWLSVVRKWALFLRASLGDICAAASWAAPSTITRYYRVNVAASTSFSESVLGLAKEWCLWQEKTAAMIASGRYLLKFWVCMFSVICSILLIVFHINICWCTNWFNKVMHLLFPTCLTVPIHMYSGGEIVLIR